MVLTTHSSDRGTHAQPKHHLLVKRIYEFRYKIGFNHHFQRISHHIFSEELNKTIQF